MRGVMLLIYALYSGIFWLPSLVVLVMLWRLWSVDALVGRSATLFPAWFIVALAVQYFAGTQLLSLTAMLLQTILAITLTLKWTLEAL